MSEKEAPRKDEREKEKGTTDVFSIPSPERTYRIEPETVVRLHRLADIFERMNLAEYLSNTQKPLKVAWYNFVMGLARGFGFSIGMTLLLGFTLYLLSSMVDVPLIGKYVAKIVAIVQQEMSQSHR
ncbi:MAG TPA: DUF5665 domain-containing protein [bacterium]|nr:DUF5665 domain-containing protein [bacterium]